MPRRPDHAPGWLSRIAVRAVPVAVMGALASIGLASGAPVHVNRTQPDASAVSFVDDALIKTAIATSHAATKKANPRLINASTKPASVSNTARGPQLANLDNERVTKW